MVFQPFCYFGPHKYAVIIKLNCETDFVAGRNKIANQLQIDVRYVTLWLKQADLWRIPDMDANLAYLAVLAGVRHVEDYAKVDPKKLMPVLRTLVASHPDMKLPNEETVSMSIDYAKLFVKNMSGKTYLKDDMAAKKAEREDLLVEIYGFDPVTNDLEKTLTNLLARTDLDTDAGNLVLNHNVFTGNFNDKPKVLPSVKLMGEGETAVKLPTDTAPSRVFNYNMIQRLVEPNVVPPAKSNSERETLDKPVDVGDFKKKIAENPTDIPQMASLGIGYVLNMHQAWVPDGFALGTLLYSTILAPGEEQRLVVRESSQSYEVLDTAESSEAVAEDYTTSQVDDTTATYNYAVNQLMTGESSSKFQVKSTSVGFSAGGGYMGCSLGLNVGHSKTSGSASSSARQNNSHDEASAAAQNFQHGIKTASERISQAKRISMRAATSNETDC